MNYLVLEILLGVLFIESCQCRHHHELSERGKRVWEFGKDVPRSYIIKNEEGTVDKRTTVLDFVVPHCHEVVYVRVEVFNPVATPKVTSNLKRAIIKYSQGQIIDSKYKIVVKTDKTCDFRCTGSDSTCKHHTNKKAPMISKSINQERGRTVAEFGNDMPQNFMLVDSMGTIGKYTLGLDLHVKVPSCQRVNYVKVEVVNSMTNPKVTTDFKVVSIKYELRQNLHSSTYKVIAKGINSCKDYVSVEGFSGDEDNSADIYKI